MVGGSDSESPPRPLASAELYDPETGAWHATGTLSTARSGHTATLLASGQVLVLGGESVSTPHEALVTASAEVYDPATGSWTPAAPMLAARVFHTATRLRSDAVLVAGGSGAISNVEMEAELYDPAAGTWRQTGSLRVPHIGHTATLLPSARVLVVGGSSISGGLIPNSELFDPDSGTWSDAGCTLEPRTGHTATLLPSGAVLVAGGFDANFNTKSSAELYGIVVSPAQVSLAPGASQTFTARAGSGFGYVWSFVHNGSGATLTGSGDYRAGPVGGVTDVVQVVDSFANSATATVNVIRQSTALSTTGPQPKSVGCGTADEASLPALSGAVVLLLAWRSLCVRRQGQRPTG